MNIIIRLSKSYDLDLIYLRCMGYNMAAITKEAVTSYIYGTPLHLYVEKYDFLDTKELKSMRYTVIFPDTDDRTIRFLKGIKNYYRAQFSKACLRNTLIQQGMPVYFTSKNFNELNNIHLINLQNKNINLMLNVKNCSDIKIKTGRRAKSTANTVVQPIATPITIPIPIQVPIQAEIKYETTEAKNNNQIILPEKTEKIDEKQTILATQEPEPIRAKEDIRVKEPIVTNNEPQNDRNSSSGDRNKKLLAMFNAIQ